MKQQLLFLFVLLTCLQANAQNVGIGTNNPSRAKLEVHGAVGANSAIFGGESTGISLQRNWPGIGFNQYYNNGNKYIGDGFGGVQYLDPNTGGFSMDLFTSGTANGDCFGGKRIYTFYPSGVGLIGSNFYNANLAVSRGVNQVATACFFGETYHSFFNHDFQQNTYIRAGKANGKVFINDIPGSSIIMSGNVGINTATPAFPLEIRQVNGKGLAIVEPSNFNSWDISMGGGNGYLYLSFNGAGRGVFNSFNGHYTEFSDRRLKIDIDALSPLLDKIMRLTPVKYKMKSGNPSQQNSIGFIAQDVKELFPELVTVINDTASGYKEISDLHTLNYSGFGVLAIKAIQEQQAIIDELKLLVTTQQQAYENLLTRLQVLESKVK